MQESLDRGTNFDLTFFAQQCRYNTEPTISQPNSTTGPESCPSPATNSCPIDAQSPTFPTIEISPSVSSPTFTVPSSDYRDLVFDNTSLPDKSILDLSKAPAKVRFQLNSNSGIELTERVLSNSLASRHIKEMPDSPGKLKLGANNPAARIGATKNDSKAVVNGKATLKNNSTVVGTIETDGTFTLKGRSAVAGEVKATTVEAIKNSFLVGDLTTTTAGNELSIESESLVCGTIDAAGKIQIKQSRVNGTVTAAGSIRELNESTVTDDVTTTRQGTVSIKSKSLVNGKIDADGAIPEVKSSEVTGPLEANGNIGSVKQSEIGGDVTTTDGGNGTVTVEESTIGGSIDADGRVEKIQILGRGSRDG